MAIWLRKPRGKSAPASLTREHVLWSYRLFLDREPESEVQVADKLAAWESVRQLRVDFMTSEEFRQKNPDLAMANEPTVVIKEISTGLRLFVDLSDQVIGMGILRGRYETAELEFVRHHVRAGDTVLDIGANIGLFTINMAAMVGGGGRVYAFEPSPGLADLLARSVVENSFGDRIEVVRAAVADRPGRRQLFLSHDSLNRGGSYLVRDDVPPEVSGELLEIPVIQLDSQPLRRPIAFIKIDIEGAEPLVLRGAERILREDRPTVLAEINPTQLARVAGSTPSALYDFMHTLGYASRTLDDRPVDTSQQSGDGLRSIVFAPRQPRHDRG